jgi:tetratricopeptide (TPR) repeat protein
MTDGVFPDRLIQLRARWESDPASRIFLQLAEEYRHLGRVQDALAVLDKGLSEHPGYLSALVAKGRCHLELGDGESARVVLERVVKQDATQMVANKLLVRAYLETGDPVKARERLDLYSLLNDSDPEIEDLRRRIRQLEKPVQAERPGQDADPFLLGAPLGPPPLPPSLPTTPRAQSGPADVFELDLPAPPRRGGDDIFELAPAAAPRAAAAPAPAPAAVAEPEEEPVAEENMLFPGLSSRDSRRRYLDSLGAEGLFAFEPPAAPAPVQPPPPAGPPPAAPPPVLAAPAPFAPPPPISLIAEPFAPGLTPVEPFAREEPSAQPEPEAELAAEEASWLDEATAAAPTAPSVPVLEPLMPPVFEPEPPVPVFAPEATTAEELWSEDAAPFEPEPPPPPIFEPEPPPPFFDLEPSPVFAPAPAPEPLTEAAAAAGDGETVTATATLGELYFRQGHYEEAERIFREVLQREPGNAAALSGLERLAALGPQPETPRLDARRLLAGYRPDAARPADVEARSRKIFLLSRYLERLRQGRPSDVS